MRRLDAELLARTKRFAHRMVDVAEALEAGGRSFRVTGRVIDQIVGAGTSVGANTREADEASSRADFCRALATVLKELGESAFWIEFVSERDWLPSERLASLATEAGSLTKIFNAMVARTRRNDREAAAGKRRRPRGS